MSAKKVYKANSNGFYVGKGYDTSLGCPANMGCPDFGESDSISGGQNSFSGYIQSQGQQFPQTMGFDFSAALSNLGTKLVDSAQNAVVKLADKTINKTLGVTNAPPALSADQIAQGYTLNAQGQAVQTTNTNSYVTQVDPNMRYYLMGGAAFLGVILLISVIKR